MDGEKSKDEIVNFFTQLGHLIGNKITGAAYSERGGDSVITLNLINEGESVITAFHIPLDLQALGKKAGEEN